MKKLVFILCISSLISCQSTVFKNDISKLLNVSDAEITSSKGIDEFGGYGEGYSIEVYQLSEKTILDFKDNLVKKLPMKKDTDIWQKKDWSYTPIDSSFKEIFIMGLNYSSGNKKIEAELNEIKLLIEKSKVYYSFYFKPDIESPQEIQLFILDEQSRKLYVIEMDI